LEKLGLYTSGELRFPEEKRVEKIELTSQLRQELEEAVRDILRIAYLEKPPQPKKINFCRKCAYAEFCWS
jgi:CRISPR-associated exonuclease Cas4